jgi:hypothetical protein
MVNLGDFSLDQLRCFACIAHFSEKKSRIVIQSIIMHKNLSSFEQVC